MALERRGSVIQLDLYINRTDRILCREKLELSTDQCLGGIYGNNKTVRDFQARCFACLEIGKSQRWR